MHQTGRCAGRQGGERESRPKNWPSLKLMRRAGPSIRLLREQRFACVTERGDRLADRGPNDLSVELVVVVDDQVTHPCDIGPRNVRAAGGECRRHRLDGLTDCEDVELDGGQNDVGELAVVWAPPT